MDPSTASRLTLAAGASLDGVDFQMTRRAALILRGGVSSADPEAVAGGVNLLLLPANRLMRGLLQWGAQANVQDRTFEIGPLMPGPYVLYAYNNREGRIFAAQRTIELGTVSPDPVEMQLTSSAELKGSVQFDSDDHPPESGQIMMAPVDRPFFMQQPQGQIDKEGGFMLTGVLPGRWRLMVNIAGYVKSVSLGGLQASPYLLDIPAGASGPLRIVVGTKMATVSVKIADAPADRQTAALIFPEDSERLGAGLERTGTTLGAAPLEFAGLPPGRYRVFATDSQNPWALLQRPDLLKALESRTAVVEVQEGGRASTTVEIVPREDLARLLEEKE
jgi:hypothetical protein